MDGASRNALIGKLTAVYLNLAPNEASRTPVTLRLADLHAERARLLALEESNRGCPGECTGGMADRKKALQYYKEVSTKLTDASQFRVRLQMGHLQDLIGQPAEAQKTFEGVLASAAPAETKADAELALGEMFYKKRDYLKARTYFQNLTQNTKAGSRGLAAYRMAWCDLNTGKLESAIDGMKKLLSNPQLLSRNASAENPVVDKQFHEEVSRDYATFLARGSIQPNTAQELLSLSPESTQISNVVFLAGELERLGQRQNSLMVWRFALQQQRSPMDRLESQVHLANLEMLVGNRQQSVADLEAALRLWPAVQPCPDAETCKELKSRIKNYLVDWNKNEAQKPSEELLGAYKNYLQVFAEADVALWAAKVAGALKNFPEAVQLYTVAAQIEMKAQPVSAEKLEVALVGAMESAELTKDKGQMELAYTSYLQHSPNKKRELEVLYQRAKLIYDSGDSMKAATAMKEVALSKASGPESVKNQAADLALDALVLAKNDALLEEWSREFSQRFPQGAKEFYSIQRTAVLNQVQAVDAKKDSSEQDLQQAWVVLSRFNLLESSPKDQAIFYKNRLVLAEKLRKFPEAREACDRLLNLPGVSSEDVNYALSRKAWLSEMIFDFDGAYVSTQKMSQSKTPEHWLKLAMYAELSQKDPVPAYREFLKVSKDEEKNALIAAEIVKVVPATAQIKELNQQKALLLTKPEIYGSLALELYSRTQDKSFLAQVLGLGPVKATAAGKILTRAQLLNEYEVLKATLEQHKLDPSNQKKMAASLKKRVALLEEMEKLAAKSIQAADWSAQLLTLHVLGTQSEKFYSELMTLPVPQGLTGEEEQMYLQALSQQASPYQVKAKDIQAKLLEFWGQDAALETLNKDLQKSYGSVEKMLWREYQLVAGIAPEAKKPMFVATQPSSGSVKPDLKELEKARQVVRENPTNMSLLQELAKVEKSMGNTKMVAYLEGRMEEMSREERKVKQ